MYIELVLENRLVTLSERSDINFVFRRFFLWKKWCFTNWFVLSSTGEHRSPPGLKKRVRTKAFVWHVPDQGRPFRFQLFHAIYREALEHALVTQQLLTCLVYETSCSILLFDVLMKQMKQFTVTSAYTITYKQYHKPI